MLAPERHVSHVTRNIPFNLPFIIGKELNYIAQAVLDGNLAGDGPFSHKCCTWMEERFGAKKVLLTHSCTAALEMAAILCDIEPGDEVIMPSYTFVSTANAFVLRGARPVFVDIRPDTLNINEILIEAAITPRTKVICPVHYAGVACEMDMIMEIADRHNLLVVEDAAQAVNATYRGRYLGTIGHLGCFSFHETKNFIAGEGGALVVNDDRFVARAETVRDKGTNRARFSRGEVAKYTWTDIGSSYLPSELTAAFLFAQLEGAEQITRARLAIWQRYMEGLRPLASTYPIGLPTVPPEAGHPAHMFYIILQSEARRISMIAHLKRSGINAVFHYIPLHLSPMGKQLGYAAGDLPVTEDLAARLLRLPCYFALDDEQQQRIIAAVGDGLEGASEDSGAR
jgi:dTDP-4-amino-4,6-dideoxygalactose transaminase